MIRKLVVFLGAASLTVAVTGMINIIASTVALVVLRDDRLVKIIISGEIMMIVGLAAFSVFWVAYALMCAKRS